MNFTFQSEGNSKIMNIKYICIHLRHRIISKVIFFTGTGYFHWKKRINSV
jgi:hypothetical protein